jgi:CHAD domain-containing protein
MGGARRAVHATGVSPETSIGTAARVALAHELRVLDRELAAARAGKVAGVHDVRVAMRRLRAEIALFERALPRRAAAAVDRELRALGRTVGAVRDLDVLAAAVAKRGRRIDPGLEPAVATILRHVREARRGAHAALVASLDAPRTRRLLARLAALPRRAVGAEACGQVGAELVRPLAHDLVRAGRRLDAGASAAVLHRLRIRAKRLRYALEALDGLGAEARARLVRRLAALQRVIGDQRDASSQRAWLLEEVPAFVGDAEALVAIGAIGESLRRRSRRLQRKVVRAWRRVERPKLVTAVLRELETPAARKTASAA